MTESQNKDNRYKIRIFIFWLFVLIIVLTSGLVFSQNKSEVTTWLRKYVYLYELPNTSPEQVLLEVQSDLAWHSIILTKKEKYWYQLYPTSQQQFSVFAKEMLDVKVEYNEIPTNITTEKRIWFFREAINAPKGPGAFGSLAMGYFVEKFRRAPLSTLIVDNIVFELINITKILEKENLSPNNKKLLATFGLHKANATVLDFERMRKDKSLIKGKTVFQNVYFQQIQSLQSITNTVKSSADMTSANNIDSTPTIVAFLILIIVLVLAGWGIIYYIIWRVNQSLSELKEKIEEVSPKSNHSEILFSQLKNDFAEIVLTQNEKIDRLEENIIGIVEQLKQLCPIVFYIQGQAEQVDEKIKKANDIVTTAVETLSSMITTQSDKTSDLERNIIGIEEQLKENQDAISSLYQVVSNTGKQVKQFNDVLATTLQSQLKDSVSQIVIAQNEKLKELEDNIVKTAEQLKENQNTTAKLLYQVMFDVQAQIKQIDGKFSTDFENFSSQLKVQNDGIKRLEEVVKLLEENQDVLEEDKPFVPYKGNFDI